MSEAAPLLAVTTVGEDEVCIHIDRIIKIAPSDPEPATNSRPEPEHGSILTLATGAGTISIGVTEYLLQRGTAELAGFLLLTDLHGIPIKINPAYVILLRSRQPSGTVLEVHNSTGMEPIHVQDDFTTVRDWWALVARARLADPGIHW
jgi:hypothetical protein